MYNKPHEHKERLLWTKSEVAIPLDLAQGDIVQTRLWTQVPDDIRFRIRNCMVLGMQLDQKENEIRGFWVARLKNNHIDAGPTDILLHDPERIPYFKEPFCIRADRLDFVELNTFNFAKVIRRVGTIPRDYFEIIDGCLAENGVQIENENCFNIRKPPEIGINVPSLHRHLIPEDVFSFQSVPPLEVADQYTLARLHSFKATPSMFSLDETKRLTHFFGYTARSRRPEFYPAKPEAEKSPPSAHEQKVSESAKTLAAEIRARRAQQRKKPARHQITRMPNANSEEVSDFYLEHANRFAILGKRARTPGLLAQRLYDAARNRPVPYDLIDFRRENLYGLAHDLHARLPAGIIPGDVVTCHIANLPDFQDITNMYQESNQAWEDTSHRPCVVLDILEDTDTGKPAALMLLPCTRMAKWRFLDTIRIRNPFNNHRRKIGGGGFVVLNRVVVAPLTTEIFPEVQNTCNHLQPKFFNHIVYRFMELLEARPDRVKFVGLNNIPPTWVSRRMKALEEGKIASAEIEWSPKLKEALKGIDSNSNNIRKLYQSLSLMRKTVMTSVAALGKEIKHIGKNIGENLGLLEPDVPWSNASVIAQAFVIAKEDSRKTGHRFRLKHVTDIAMGTPDRIRDDPRDDVRGFEDRFPQGVDIKHQRHLTDIQFGDVILYQPTAKEEAEYMDRRRRSRDPYYIRGLVWMVYKDSKSDDITGVGIIPYHEGFDDFDKIQEAKRDPRGWGIFCTTKEEMDRMGVSKPGRFLTHNLHILPNNGIFFTPLSQQSKVAVDTSAHEFLIRKRFLAVMNAPSLQNFGLHSIPREWMLEDGPVYNDGNLLLPIPIESLPPVRFSPDARCVQQALECWQKTHGHWPKDSEGNDFPSLLPPVKEHGGMIYLDGNMPNSQEPIGFKPSGDYVRALRIGFHSR